MTRMLATFLILFFSGVAIGQQQDSFEVRMHNIYKQSYSEEISDERWAGYLTGVGNRSYTVRPGDTLWDLSVVFFGDGLFWSKIWSYNSSLTNPHLLSVGQNIQFFTGTVEQAPGVSVEPEGEEPEAAPPVAQDSVVPSNLPEGFTEVKVEGETEVAVDGEAAESTGATVDLSGEETIETLGQNTPNQPAVRKTPKITRSNLYPGAPAIPPPSQLVKPVLKVLPTTFTESQTYDASQYDEKGISFDIRPPVRVNPLFVAHQFLYGRNARNYPNVGRLIESENKTNLVGVNQMVYLEAKEKLEIGERFTVMGLDYPFDRNGVIGDVIQYQASLEITEKIRDNIYRGVVIKSLDGIKGHPWISREEIPTFKDDYVGRPNQKKLQIIGGGKDNVTRFYGQSDVIFIHGGTNQGVRVGDVMGVYKRRDFRYRNTTVSRSPVPIGHIKIFRAEPELSSAFVISSDDIIVPGDETGPPTIVEAIATQSEKMDLNSIETGLDFQSEPEAEAEPEYQENFDEDNFDDSDSEFL